MPKILVVDDETVITTQLEEHLTFMGYEVVGSASSGEEAIDMARDLKPDIILMDIVMQPGGLDGIDATEMIQAGQDIPVIFLTAFANDKYVERAKNAQPFGYILKPFQEKEVRACIEVALHKKETERQLRESEERHRSVVDTAGEAIIIVDSRRNIISWNHAAEKMFGYTTAEATGKPFTLMIPERLRKELEHEMNRMVSTGTSAMPGKMVEYTGLRKDGSEFPIEFYLTTWKAREEIFFTIITADITARKCIEEILAMERASLAERVRERTAELSEANAELSRALHLKDEFLAIMSHEVRTPLNVILGMTEVLQEKTYGPLNDQQLSSLCAIKKSGHRLLGLLTDILDLSQITAGVVELNMTLIPVESICQATLQLITPLAHEKRLKVLSSFDRKVTIMQTNGRYLHQVLMNLLNNAIKFTPEGGKIGLDVKGDAEKQVVHFTVWDTGIGIAEEDMARLFQSFVQLDSSLSRGYEGAGLGLSLAYHIVDMHGGSISVESEVGKGSRFTVSLPWWESGDREMGRWGDREIGR